MDYGKIIEDYQKILKEHGDCEKTFDKEYKELTDSIDILLSDTPDEKLRKEFSNLFNLWILANKFENDQMREGHHNSIRNNHIGEGIKERQAKKFLNITSFHKLDEIKESQEVIEYMLNILWLKIFKKTFLNLNIDKKIETNLLKNGRSLHKNWPLYEIINQVSRTINNMIKDKTSQEIQISSLSERDKNELLSNTDTLCQHILNTYILNTQNKINTVKKWIPTFPISDETKLSYAIATSELVSYIFEYKLMDNKKKKIYLSSAQDNIEDIYNNLIYDKVLYTAGESHINAYKKEKMVIKYKNNLFDPTTVLVLIISTIQELTKKSLSQSRKNIFYTINKKYRDTGLTKNDIIAKIKKDQEKYMLIYRYLDNPVKATVDNKKEKLKNWMQRLQGYQYGVLDDYLDDLSKTTGITFEEEIVTTLTFTPKP